MNNELINDLKSEKALIDQLLDIFIDGKEDYESQSHYLNLLKLSLDTAYSYAERIRDSKKN